MSENALTEVAFGEYRKKWSPEQQMHQGVARFAGDTDQLSEEDGLMSWHDGSSNQSSELPLILHDIDPHTREKHLWVVIDDEVLHAKEYCDFGEEREAGRIKHSNLTGGGLAFMGGEILLAEPNVVLLNGCSGRYRCSSEAELSDVAKAFAKSGYVVFSMGYDHDTDRPALFGVKEADLVAA